MKTSRIFAGALACALLVSTSALAQSQGLPGALGPGGASSIQNTPVTPCIAPAGGGQGTCDYIAHDNPLPVGQVFADISVTPTVTASSAYSTGNAVGNLITISGAVAKAGYGGRIEEVTLYSKSSQSGEIDFVWCGSQNPTGSTITDKTAVSIASADFNKCRTVAQLTNWQSFGTTSVVTSGQLATPFVIGTGTSGYGFLIARSTPTFASTSDLQLTLRIGH